MSRTPDRPAAFAFFLVSLLIPGLGQILQGAVARGALMLALTGGLAAAAMSGALHLPGATGFGPVDAGGAFVWGLLLAFAAYDAWFLARERVNGMVALLPRTPRVAAFADCLLGGAGALYLGRPLGLAVVAGSLALLAALWHWGSAWQLTLLAVWNLAWAASSQAQGSRRYHSTAEFRCRRDRLRDAPLDSPLAPSPSLPLATLLAAFILAAGLLAVTSGVRSGWATSPVPHLTGTITDGAYVDPGHGLRLSLLDGGWRFATGEPPFLLVGEQPAQGRSFTLAVILNSMFAADDVVPAGALARFASRQEAELSATVPGFDLLSRTPVDEAGRPGFRLVFRSTGVAGRDLTVQQYLLHEDRIIVLTLAGPLAGGIEATLGEMDRMAAALTIE